MTEILTESFCERCGTRYTFETAAPRRSRLGRVRVASKGLRNYVMQDESSFSEAMADARSDMERSATTHQLDAFHKTFNFCMTCRQYTCGNCWNAAEGRCLTCSPLPEAEPPAIDLVEAIAPDAPEVAEPAIAAAEDESWPEADLGPERLARAMGLAGSAAVADAAGPELAGEEAVADVPLVRGLTPGQSLEDALAEYEAQIAAQEDAALADAPAAESADVEPEVRARSRRGRGRGRRRRGGGRARGRRAGAGARGRRARGRRGRGRALADLADVAAAEPVAAEPSRAGAAAAEPVAAEQRADVVPQPTWPVPTVAPEAPTTPRPVPQTQPDVAPPSNPWLTVAPDDGAAAPQWPTAPQWGARPGTTRELPTTLAGRPIVPQDNAAALWAASAREVLTGGPTPATPTAAAPATPQPCVSCGLSLSPNARFCRRCGTRQG